MGKNKWINLEIRKDVWKVSQTDEKEYYDPILPFQAGTPQKQNRKKKKHGDTSNHY